MPITNVADLIFHGINQKLKDEQEQKAIATGVALKAVSEGNHQFFDDPDVQKQFKTHNVEGLIPLLRAAAITKGLKPLGEAATSQVFGENSPEAFDTRVNTNPALRGLSTTERAGLTNPGGALDTLQEPSSATVAKNVANAEPYLLAQLPGGGGTGPAQLAAEGQKTKSANTRAVFTEQAKTQREQVKEANARAQASYIQDRMDARKKIASPSNMVVTRNPDGTTTSIPYDKAEIAAAKKELAPQLDLLDQLQPIESALQSHPELFGAKGKLENYKQTIGQLLDPQKVSTDYQKAVDELGTEGHSPEEQQQILELMYGKGAGSPDYNPLLNTVQTYEGSVKYAHARSLHGSGRMNVNDFQNAGKGFSASNWLDSPASTSAQLGVLKGRARGIVKRITVMNPGVNDAIPGLKSYLADAPSVVNAPKSPNEAPTGLTVGESKDLGNGITIKRKK